MITLDPNRASGADHPTCSNVSSLGRMRTYRGGHPDRPAGNAWPTGGHRSAPGLVASWEPGLLRDDLAAAGPVPVDDVLDAAAVAWTAGRIAPGVALCLPPDQPLEDVTPSRIWL